MPVGSSLESAGLALWASPVRKLSWIEIPRPDAVVSSAQISQRKGLWYRLLAKYSAQGWKVGALKINPWN